MKEKRSPRKTINLELVIDGHPFMTYKLSWTTEDPWLHPPPPPPPQDTEFLYMYPMSSIKFYKKIWWWLLGLFYWIYTDEVKLT